MDIQKITQLMDLLSGSDLTELHLQEGEDSLRLLRGSVPNREAGEASVLRVPAPGPAAQAAQVASPSDDTRRVFNSPMVGTFFRAGSPGAVPFVEVGSTVRLGQTLGVIEAMKMLTEIECDVEGRVCEILVENGTFVEYGQPLFTIEASRQDHADVR